MNLFRSTFAVMAVLIGLTITLQARADEPVDIVRETTDILFEMVESNRAEYEQNLDLLQERIRGTLLPRIDILYSGRLVLGRSGRGLDNEKIEEFSNALSNLLIRQYADGLLEFKTRDQLDILPLAGENTQRMTRVKTLVGLDNGQTAPVDYVFRKHEGDWKIFDVIVEGISYIATFRNQIGDQIRQEGFETMLAKLKNGEIEVKVDD